MTRFRQELGGHCKDLLHWTPVDSSAHFSRPNWLVQCPVHWSPAQSSPLDSHWTASHFSESSPDPVKVMSPYKLMSRTHSLSTEDFSFIHSFIYLLTPWEPFTISRKMSCKSKKKCAKNMDDSCCCHNVEEAVLRVQGPYLKTEQSQKIG